MPERDWIDVEIDLRDAVLDPHERPSRRMLANACLGVGLEDAYYSVREFREAVTLIHSGECRGRRKLAEILGEERWAQGECMLGHRKSSTSDIYALRNPASLGAALKATESILDNIERLCPGAFTAPLPQLLKQKGSKMRLK